MSEQLQPETLELVGKIRASLKVLHGQMREVERALASLPQAEPAPMCPCPVCGLEFRTLRRLKEHLENVHPGPTLRAGPRPEDEPVPMVEWKTLDRLLPKRDDA